MGTVVLVAHAVSRNVGPQTITYSLTDTGGTHDFRIDPASGEVLTNASLDYVRKNDYHV